MIFFVDSGGTIFKSIPEKVYQGSVNANTIYFVGAFPSNCSVTLSYRLPNSNYTTPELMARVTESDLTDIQTAKGQGYNVWSAKINGVATENYGTVAVQFFVYATNGTGSSVRLATASSSFEVSRGVPIVLPDETDYYEKLLTDILSALSEVRLSADNTTETAQTANENANTALSNSSTALQTATNAESLAQNAVSTANSSLQQAKDYTDEQIANYGLYVVVSELPETGLPNKIYLVPTTNATENNIYDEYLWVNGAWEFQGSSKVDIDLSDTKIKEIVAETYLVGETAPTTETVAQFIGQLYVSGTSTYQCTKITTNESTGVKNYTWVRLIRATDYARESAAGVISVSSNYGTQLAGAALAPLTWEGYIDNRKNAFMSYLLLDYAVKVGITTNTETLTDEEKENACDWLGVAKKDYVDNLPDYLTLTEEQKAKWQNWLGITVTGKMQQEIGEVGEFYPIIQGTKSFAETAITPELGVLYYDVLTNIIYNWSGTSYDVQAEFQEKYDDTLETDDKTVAGAINELNKKIENSGSTGESAKLYEHFYPCSLSYGGNTNVAGVISFYSNSSVAFSDFESLKSYLRTCPDGFKIANGMVEGVIVNIYGIELLSTVIQIYGATPKGNDINIIVNSFRAIMPKVGEVK